MPVVIVVLTVVGLLLGGQALFLDALRSGLVVGIGALSPGVVVRSSTRSSEGPHLDVADLGAASPVDSPRGRARGRGA